jgi:membrane protease YdiL (CAAX protease family)
MSEIKEPGRKNYIKYLSVITFIGLLVLRFPFLIIARTFYTDIPDATIRLIFENGTYLLTAILILLEKDRLSQFKINVFAITIFLLAPILRPITYKMIEKHISSYDLQFSQFKIIVSVLLFLCLFICQTKIHKDTFKYTIQWIMISFLAGILLAIGTSLVYSHFDTRGPQQPTITIFIELFITQLSSAAICEEPLFRGFLWGHLEKRGWKQIKIWLFQAGMFCFAHLYYLPQHPVFFAGTFVSALVLGALVWRSKSIGSSMIAHGTVNSLGDLLLHCTWK